MGDNDSEGSFMSEDADEDEEDPIWLKEFVERQNTMPRDMSRGMPMKFFPTPE